MTLFLLDCCSFSSVHTNAYLFRQVSLVINFTSLDGIRCFSLTKHDSCSVGTTLPVGTLVESALLDLQGATHQIELPSILNFLCSISF